MSTPKQHRGGMGKKRAEAERRSIAPLSTTFTTACALLATIAANEAQTLESLSRYVDLNGVLPVETLTCAQLSNTYQDDADFLAAWYSGWYSDLSRKHMGHITRARVGEYEVSMYCRAHPDLRIVDAITAIMNDDQ